MGPMQNPSCNICKSTFKKMEILNTHMKILHNETDNMRIERLTITIDNDVNRKFTDNENTSSQSLKIFDCTECGIIFPTAEEQKSHNEKEHDSKINNLDNLQKEDVKTDEEDNP